MKKNLYFGELFLCHSMLGFVIVVTGEKLISKPNTLKLGQGTGACYVQTKYPESWTGNRSML